MTELTYLLTLIAAGFEFPDAVNKTADRYNLSNVQIEQLEFDYDLYTSI